jgi:hypothetical protein
VVTIVLGYVIVELKLAMGTRCWPTEGSKGLSGELLLYFGRVVLYLVVCLWFVGEKLFGGWLA